MKLTIWVLSAVVAILGVFTITLATKSKAQGDHIATLESQADLLNSQLSGLEEQKSELTQKFSNLSSAYRLLSQEKTYPISTVPLDVGDKVTGDFNSFGIRDFYNQTTDDESHLWIDDYMLGKDEAMDNLKDNCQ